MYRHRSTRFASRDPFVLGQLDFTGGRLRFGRRTFAALNITGYRIESGEKSGLLGNIVAAALFILLAAGVLEAIVAQVFPYRALIGVVTLGFVGLASAQDTWLERGSGFYKLFISLAEGKRDEMVYATSDQAEMHDVAGRLAQVLAVRAGDTAESAPKTAGTAG